MAGSIVAAAQQLAQRLKDDAGIAATADPGWAANHRPCVLVPPPAIDYTRRLNTWRLVALAGKDHGDLDSLRQLDELVRAVVAVLPIEAADPGSYVLTGGGAAVPAYILRMTT
jgi:hypothetical protein